MKPLLGKTLALATCIMLIACFFVPFAAFGRYAASHTIYGSTYYTDYSLICGKCHTQQFTEQETATAEYPSKHSAGGGQAACDYCHGKAHKIARVNCTDCHGDKLVADVHATIYPQLGESGADATATCIACHSPIPVTIEETKTPSLTLRIE